MNNPDLSKTTGRTIARLLILLASVALLATACSKSANTNNANTATTNTSSTSTTTSSSNISSTSASPIAAYKAFQEANRKKDYEGVKRVFSKGSLEMITEEAKKQNKTLDEFVRQQVDRGKNDEEVSNEKINGDTATVDLKDKDGTSSITLPMVKEDGEWKIAYDKFIKQMQEAFDQMSKEGPKSSGGGANENANK